jgi:hypothetical protein
LIFLASLKTAMWSIFTPSSNLYPLNIGFYYEIIANIK